MQDKDIENINMNLIFFDASHHHNAVERSGYRRHAAFERSGYRRHAAFERSGYRRRA